MTAAARLWHHALYGGLILLGLGFILALLGLSQVGGGLAGAAAFVALLALARRLEGWGTWRRSAFPPTTSG
jgi:hypothetical protein